MKLYIAGPMTGYPEYNFPAFDEAKERLEQAGYEVVSPADLDREMGFDPNTTVWGKDKLKEVFKNDIVHLMECDGVALLAGHKGSKGAQAETTIARWLGLTVMMAHDWIEEATEESSISAAIHYGDTGESILEEASRLTRGERMKDYGTPKENLSRIAKMWEVIFGTPVTPDKVATAMIAVKICRTLENPEKRDSWTDMAGYSDVGYRSITEQ